MKKNAIITVGQSMFDGSVKNTLLGAKQKKLLAQLVRFGLVGIVSNLISFCIYLLVTFLGVSPIITMTLLYATSATIGFFGNRELTFSYEGNLLNAGMRYVFVQFCGFLINLIILIALVDQLGYPHQWVQAAAIFIVAIYLFIALKIFVFRQANICRMDAN